MRGFHLQLDSARARDIAYFGGGSGTTTTTTNTQPWAGQQPFLLEGMTDAQTLLQSGNWPQYYPNSTYSPVTQDTWNTLGQIYNTGMSGGTQALQSDQGFLGNLLGSGGTAQTAPGMSLGTGTLANQTDLGAAYNTANTQLGDLATGSANGYFNSSNGIFGNLGSGATGSSLFAQPNSTFGALASGEGNGLFGSANSALTSYLNGSQLNPYTAPGFQSVVNNTLANVLPAVSSQFGGDSGRLDSGLATAAETQAATNAVGQLANQNYVQEQGLQQQAAQTAAGIGGQELSGVLSGAQGQASDAQAQLNAMLGGGQGLASNAQAQANTQLQGSQGLANAVTQQQQVQQGAANDLTQNYLTQQGNQVKASMFAPAADNASEADLQAALGLGQTQQQDSQAALTANINAWNYNQSLPWNMLNEFMGDVSGSYGQMSTVTQPYYSNSAANAISGLGGIAGIGSSLFGSGGMFPGALAALGPVLASL